MTTAKADLSHPAVRRQLWALVGRELGFDAKLADELEATSDRFRKAAGWLEASECPDNDALQASYDHVLEEMLDAARVIRRAADTARGVAVLAERLSVELDEEAAA